MAQLTLFGSGDVVLTDDERGRIVYTTEFIDVATAQRWFDEIRQQVEWRSATRMMYARRGEVPRLLGSFRFDPPPASVPSAIVGAEQRVTDHLGVPCNPLRVKPYRV